MCNYVLVDLIAAADCEIPAAYVVSQTGIPLSHQTDVGACKEWLFGPVSTPSVGAEREKSS